MPKTILRFLLGSVLLIASQACAPASPTPTTPDPNLINTAVAQTIVVLTQTSQPQIPVTGDESPTAMVTVAAPTSTAIVLPTLSLSSTPAVTAVTPALAQVSVSVPTNCRVGPGTTYARVGALLVGEVAEVIGTHATRDYWIIRNPDRPGETCWLWGEYATLTGNTGVLPVFTPPPTPTPSPDLTAAFNGLEVCTGTGWWVDIELENPGGISFTSLAMTVRDTTTDTVLSLYSEDFTDRDGCSETNTRDNLPAGEELLVSSPVFNSDPSGHELRVTITLCSNPGQSGMCVTESINFTP